MAVFGIDYAWGFPGVTALNRAGVKFAARYLSTDAGKNLSPAEARQLSGAGIWIVVVWETTANRALAGKAAGVADAHAASAQARACGMPAGRPIFFAVDFDATGGQEAAISAYLDGAATVLGQNHVGIYGGYSAIKHAFDGGHAAFGWQTYAWSGGAWDSRAQIQQYSNNHYVGGVGCDYNRAVKADYGQWQVGSSPSPAPQPQQEDEDTMPYGQLTEGSQAITPISLPRGRYKSIGFICDNGLQKLPATKIRVAIHTGADVWEIHTVDVDSAKGQAVITFTDPTKVDGLSVRREDAGNVHVAWQVS